MNRITNKSFQTRLLISALAFTTVALLLVIMWWRQRDEERFRPTTVKRESLTAERTRKLVRPIAPPPAEVLETQAPEPVTTDPPATPESPAPTAEQPIGLYESCAADWTLITQDSVELLAQRLEQSEFVLSPACREALLQAGEARPVQDFVARCTGPTTPGSEIMPFCTDRVEAFWSFVVNQLSASTAPVDLENANITTLSSSIGASLQQPQELSESDLYQAMTQINELLQREPNAYDVHKAKLVLLLVQELRLGSAVPDEDYVAVVDELNSFRLDENPRLEELQADRAEAESQFAALREEITELAARRETLGSELAALTDEPSGTSEARFALLAEDRLLAAEQQELAQASRALQQDIRASLLREQDTVDSELIELPFVRLLAKGDLDVLREEAAAYIEENPASPLGYFFKAQAEWRSGARNTAVATLGDAVEQGAADTSFKFMFEREVRRDPSDYVDELARAIGGRLVLATRESE